MTDLNTTARIEVRPIFSAEELEVAKANLTFALENCPVDGGIVTEDGDTSSRESVEALLRRLEAVGAQRMSNLDLGPGEIRLLEAVADYAIDTCPVEGGLVKDDGSLASRADVKALREKIETLPEVATPE